MATPSSLQDYWKSHTGFTGHVLAYRDIVQDGKVECGTELKHFEQGNT